MVRKIRSKNAGPFWLTIDIFCEDKTSYIHVCKGLQTKRIAELFGIKESVIQRFDISQLNVIKISMPRPHVQGTVADTDMHGASFAVLLEEMEMPPSTH